MPQSLKPFKTFEEQIEILKSRGLVIQDEAFAIDVLSKINYYRFSGYAFLRQNKKSDGQKFVQGTTFESIYALYEFDQLYRGIVFRFLEPIEIITRTRIAYHFSQRHKNDNNDCHYCPEYFIDLRQHEVFVKKLEDLIDKNKEVPFVKKHIEAYEGRMPLWAAVEILSFSSVSQLYSIMCEEDKREISKSLGHTPVYLQNWLHVLSVLRNKCAHYGRLYGVTIAPPIQLPMAFKQKFPVVMNNSIFAAICIICKLQPNKTNVCDFIDMLGELINEYETRIDLKELMFPANWKTILNSMK